MEQQGPIHQSVTGPMLTFSGTWTLSRRQCSAAGNSVALAV